MIRPFPTTLIAVLLLGMSTAQFAVGQVLYGSAVGSIEDQSGGLVPGATVSLTNKLTGQVRETSTGEDGRYTVPNLLPGEYDLKVTAGGFRTYTQIGLQITINTVTRADVKLELGQLTEQVTVTTAVAALQTDKSDLRSEVSSQVVSSLPLAAYRNFQNLINLVPGATPAGFQNSVGSTPARALTTNINGTARNNNNARVDGATNVYIWLPHHMVYVPPVESIETVNVTTGSFDAEQGMAGGAAITVATKSGTNDIHGVVFHYHDNQQLRTRNFFLPANVDKAKSIFNIFGGTLGGPIIKDKLFYFGSFEGTLERAGITRVTDAVPTAAIRAGNFSGLPVTIFDPLTGNANGVGRTPMAGNQVPISRMNSISRKIQDLAPMPNLPGTSQGTLNNYYSSGTERLNRYNYDFKVNWNPRNDLSIWGKYSRMDANVSSVFAFGDQLGGPGLSRAGAPEVTPTVVNIPTFGFTKAFSPTLILDGTFASNRMDMTGTFPGFGVNTGSDVWGIPNTNDPVVTGPGADRLMAACPSQAGGKCYSGMPTINNGFTTWGATAGWQPHFYTERTYTYTTNATKMKGAHEFRFGFDMVRYHMDQWQPEVSGGPRGNISFSGDVTGSAGYVSNYLNTYATYLMGYTTNMQKGVQLFQYTNREWQFGGYARDRWQISKKLTLNLGLRYEYFPLITRVDRGIERWDPATNLVYMGGIGNNPNNVGITTSKKLFAPRVGFAYRVTENTVIRSGYGLTYDPMPFSRPLRGMYPSTIGSTFVSTTPFTWIGTLDQGIPAIAVPDTSTGVITLPPTVDMGPRSAWAGEIKRGYIQSWNLTVERKFPGEFVTSLGYVGTQTVHQLMDRDINAAPPGGGPAGRPLAATQNRRIAALMWDGIASGNYHALQLAINRQFSKGLLLKGAYTWSKAINWTDEDGWTGAPLWNSDSVMYRNRAAAGYNRAQMFTLGYVYELPFGPRKTLVTSGFLSHLLRDWQTNGMFSAYSGTPFTVSASGTQLNAPGNSQTADLVKEGKVAILGNIGANTSWFDPLAFRQPAGVRYGSSGRNTLFGPGIVNMDMSLFRTFRFSERLHLEFKAECFNISNTPKFSNPGANVASMSLNSDGTIRALNNYSSITSTLGGLATPSERQFRFG
ncbi:MAG: TonB-dependent receptor, partial [Bryobacterales bacterium]|nr:TonB-dependent receptor [Bryobacterales bacterium]